MIRRLAIVLLTVFLTPAAATAQERPITPDAFLDLVAGQTVTFVLAEGRTLVGVERFIDRTRSVWTRRDGTCAIGTIRVRGGKLCFAYDDMPRRESCWLPHVRDGRYFVRSTLTGELQMVAGMERRRLDCAGEPLS